MIFTFFSIAAIAAAVVYLARRRAQQRRRNARAWESFVAACGGNVVLNGHGGEPSGSRALRPAESVGFSPEGRLLPNPDLHRRLVAQLRPDWNAGAAGDESFWDPGSSSTREERWQSIHGAHELWAIYENAGVILEMGDYAARCSDTTDRELLASLRSDALQIRILVLSALARSAFSQANESICASRAAAMYADVMARTAELLEGNFGQMAPNYVAAM